MTESSDVPILVADVEVGGNGEYVEASGGRVVAKLVELKQHTTAELVRTISSIAQQLDGATLPPSVGRVTVKVGLAISAQFGVSIAGSGVDSDVSVEFEWKP